jgi:hypothetical protein
MNNGKFHFDRANTFGATVCPYMRPFILGRAVVHSMALHSCMLGCHKSFWPSKLGHDHVSQRTVVTGFCEEMFKLFSEQKR